MHFISSIARRTYDFLADGNLPQDDPVANKFKMLPVAYTAAFEGTEARNPGCSMGRKAEDGRIRYLLKPLD